MRHSRWSDAHDAGCGGNRQFAHQAQASLLEQQREAAVRTRPGYSDAQHAVLWTVGAWHTGLDDAGVLEEVEVSPAQVLPAVRLA
jgi:hypothetical protein